MNQLQQDGGNITRAEEVKEENDLQRDLEGRALLTCPKCEKKYITPVKIHNQE